MLVFADGSLDPAFGDGDGIMKYRRQVVGLSGVAVRPDGDLAFEGNAIGHAIGQEQLEREFMIAARGADAPLAAVVRGGRDTRATG